MRQQFARDGWDDRHLRYDHGMIDDQFAKGTPRAVLVILPVEPTTSEVRRLLDSLGITAIARTHTPIPGGHAHATITDEQITLHDFLDGHPLVTFEPADDDWISTAREEGQLGVIVCWDPSTPQVETIRSTSRLWSSGALPIR